MGGGSGEEAKLQEATKQAGANAGPLQMAQYSAFAPGEQQMLADQMSQFYGAPAAEYATMLAQNTQSASRPTLRTPTDIETYLNSLANSGGTSAANAQQKQNTEGQRLAGPDSPLIPTQASDHQYGVNWFGR